VHGGVLDLESEFWRLKIQAMAGDVGGENFFAFWVPACHEFWATAEGRNFSCQEKRVAREKKECARVGVFSTARRAHVIHRVVES
jgi:hypothetical protein